MHICPILSKEPLNFRQKANCFTRFQLRTDLLGPNQQPRGWDGEWVEEGEQQSCAFMSGCKLCCVHEHSFPFLFPFPSQQLADRARKVKWIKRGWKQLSSESWAHIFMILSASCCLTDHKESSIRTWFHQNHTGSFPLSGAVRWKPDLPERKENRTTQALIQQIPYRDKFFFFFK